MGQDFTLSRTEVTFGLGTNDGNVISVFVDILDDLFIEGRENFTLSGSVAPPASFVGGPVTVRIIDDDGKPLSTLMTEYGEVFHELFIFTNGSWTWTVVGKILFASFRSHSVNLFFAGNLFLHYIATEICIMQMLVA